jgi:kumamolisin
MQPVFFTSFRRPERFWHGLLFLCALVFLLTACGGQAQQQQQSTPITLPPLPSPGGLPPGLAGLQPSGLLDLNLRLQLTIGLAIDRQALADDLAAIYDPNSPQFGHYLTPQDIASRYGMSQANIDKVTAYLQAHGFQILSVSPLRDQLSVTANVAQIAQTFGAVLQLFREKNGQIVFSPSNTITLPSELSSLVTSVIGLSNVAQPNPKAPRATGAPSASDCSQATQDGETPNEIAATYGYSNAYKAGYTGKGISIGVVEFNDNISVNDLNHFLSCTTGGKLHRSIVKVDGGVKASDDGSTGEAELDFEYLAALAPDAQLVEYQDTYCAGSNTSWDCQKGQVGVPFPEGYVDILNQIAADGKVQLVSASWGNPEQNFSQSELFAFDQAIEYLAAEGITFAAATGDCGAFDGGSYNQLAVDIPAADPFALAVGGTELLTDSKGNRKSEMVWNSYQDAPDQNPCEYNDWGGGGGLSTVFGLPGWQQGSGVKNKFSNGGRELPDISANAWTDADYFKGQWEASGGTSAATPIWIAGLALVDQGLVKHHKQLVGATPTFYRVANHAGKLHPFYDITQGDNLYYPATTGYDLASGWGAPNIVDFGKVLGAF